MDLFNIVGASHNHYSIKLLKVFFYYTKNIVIYIIKTHSFTFKIVCVKLAFFSFVIFFSK